MMRALVLLAFASANTAAAQAIIVSGVVRSESKVGPVIANAEVTIVPGPNPVKTDSAGRFRVRVEGAGPAFLTVRAVGFAQLESTIAVDGPDSARVDVVLHPASAALPTVTVKAPRRLYTSPALQGFEDRRAKGFGRFVPDTVLRTMENRQLAEVLISQVAGLQVIRRGPESFVASTRTTKQNARLLDSKSKSVPGACYSTIYLDGALVFDMSSASNFSTINIPVQPPDLRDFSVSSLAGIEFYPGEATAPQGYRHSGCGLLLLWTRER